MSFLGRQIFMDFFENAQIWNHRTIMQTLHWIYDIKIDQFRILYV